MADDKYITAFAPATIGNLGVGFDMLGLAIDGAGDRVSVRKQSEPAGTIVEVQDEEGNKHPILSSVAT